MRDARRARRPFRARVCVLACGANYTLQRRLGLGMPPVFVQSAQIGTAGEALRDVEVISAAAVAPNGFAWAVPVRAAPGAFARIGLMCDGDSRRTVPALSRRSIGERWGMRCRPRLPPGPAAKDAAAGADRPDVCRPRPGGRRRRPGS